MGWGAQHPVGGPGGTSSSGIAVAGAVTVGDDDLTAPAGNTSYGARSTQGTANGPQEGRGSSQSGPRTAARRCGGWGPALASRRPRPGTMSPAPMRTGEPSAARFKHYPPVGKDALNRLTDALSNPSNALERLMKRATPELVHDETDSTSLQPPKRQQVSDSIAERMVQAYRDGMTTTEVRLKYGVSQGCMVSVLRRAGVRARHLGPDDQEARLICQLYESGMTLAEVGKRTNRDPDTVRSTLASGGVTIRPRGRRKGA